MDKRRECRRKKHVRQKHDAPFPVPIASVTGCPSSTNSWYYYTGEICQDHVIVKHSGDMTFLYSMGYFGRGLLSRGQPSLYRELPLVFVPAENGSDPDVLQVMRRRMYLRHVRWRKSYDQLLVNGNDADEENCDSDDQEFDSDIQYHISNAGNFYVNNSIVMSSHNVLMSEEPANQLFDVRQPAKDNINLVFPKSDGQLETVELSMNGKSPHHFQVANDTSTVESCDNLPANQNSTHGLSPLATVSSVDLWDTMEADKDFWASDTKTEGSEKTLITHKSDKNPDSEISWQQMREKDDSDGTINITQSEYSPPLKKQKTDKVNFPIDHMTNLDQSKHIVYDDSINKVMETNLISTAHGHSVNNSCSFEDTQYQGHNESANEMETDSDFVSDKSYLPPMLESIVSHTSTDIADIRTSNDGVNCISDVNINMNANAAVLVDNKEYMDKVNDIHPYCVNDEDDGDYLVIDDSDCDDRVINVPRNERYKWKPVRKTDAFSFVEPLVLSFEEAFFLSYGLGCLIVRDSTQTALTLPDLWCLFCRKQRFLPCYVAYHYFRSKGWVPKSGLIFGADFILYKVGPPFYHAAYSVIVKMVYEGDYEEVIGYNNRTLTWSTFAGLNRVTEHVIKTLMYCYVIMPRDMSEEELKSPKCLSRIKVKLQVINRWVSSQEREKNKSIEEMP